MSTLCLELTELKSKTVPKERLQKKGESMVFYQPLSSVIKLLVKQDQIRGGGLVKDHILPTIIVHPS